MSGHSVKEPIRSTLVEEDASFADIVDEFVNGLDDRLRALQEALSADDFDHLRSLAHQLKGSGGGYGYAILTTLAATLEQQARDKQIDDCRRSVCELASIIERVEVGADVPT